jgi:hypothetical protein
MFSEQSHVAALSGNANAPKPVPQPRQGIFHSLLAGE